MAVKKQGKGSVVTFVADVGAGTIAGYTFQDITQTEQTVEMLDATEMTSTTMEKVGSCLPDLGTITIPILHDPELDITTVKHLEGLLTIESPLTVLTNTVKEKELGQAVLSGYQKLRPVKGLMSANLTFTWTGVGYVSTPESAT